MWFGRARTAALLALYVALQQGSWGQADEGAEGECAAGGLGCGATGESPLSFQVAQRAGCTVAEPASEESIPEDEDAALECLFGALYPKRAGHLGAERERQKELTYGELRPGALSKLLRGAGLMGVPATKDDSFVDLGSGTGKLPIQAFLHGLRSSKGVELAEERHLSAAQAVDALRPLLSGAQPSPQEADSALSGLLLAGGSLALSSGDLLKLPITGSTIVFAASLCFPDWLLEALSTKLREELAPGALFWSLRSLPAGSHNGLALVGKAVVHSTWSSQSRLLLYMRTPDAMQVPAAVDAAWLSALATAARAELRRLRTAAGLEEVADTAAAVPPMRGAELERAAGGLGAATDAGGLRLLKAFASRVSRSSDIDRCGCLGDPTAREEWSVTEADIAGMLAHGLFPNRTGPDCLSIVAPCSGADALAAAWFQQLRGDKKSRRNQEVVAAPPSLDGAACMRTSDGRMPLHTAVFRDRQPFAAAALAAAGDGALRCPDQEGLTPIHIAAQHATGATMKWILEIIAAAGETGAQALLQKDNSGRTPLMASRDTKAIRAMWGASEKGGADINAVDGADQSVLYGMVVRDDVEAVDLLLELGANASSTGRMDNSPLIAAARKRGRRGSPENSRRILQALAAARADVNARHGETKTTALHVAASGDNAVIVEALLALGADPDAEATGGLRPADVAKDDAVVQLVNGAASSQQKSA